MSSLITAGRYLVDSHDKKLSSQEVYIPAFMLLADVIQNTLDGNYQQSGNTLYHDIYLRDTQNTEAKPMRANILGISLGDGEMTRFLTDKTSIQNCIDGVRGNIRILCHMDGGILGLELSTISKIRKIVALKVVISEPDKVVSQIPEPVIQASIAA